MNFVCKERKMKLIIIAVIALLATDKTKAASGYTPLHIAADRGNVNGVNKLIEQGADINAKTSPSRFTPLHLAIMSNQPETARILVENGADVYAECIFGLTPIVAAGYENANIDRVVKEAIEKRAQNRAAATS